MDASHCINDLSELISGLRARLNRNIEEVRGRAELTPTQEARFEVGVGLLHDIINDLRSMHEQWERDKPQYRSTEKMLYGANYNPTLELSKTEVH